MADTFKASTRVRIEGLSGAKQYNGKRGTVVSRCEGAPPRYLIQLDAEHKQLRVKAGNLFALTADCVNDMSISQLKLLLKQTHPEITPNVTEKSELLRLIQTHCSVDEIVNFGKSPAQPQSGSISQGAKALSEQMRSQRDMLKANPHMFSQVVAQNPQLAGKSYEDVLRHLDMLVEMDPEQLAAMKKMQDDLGVQGSGNAEAAARAIGEMDAEKLASVMSMQRDALKKNPAMFEEVLRQNPQLQGKSYEEVVAHLDMLAGMSPEDLQQMAKLQAGMGGSRSAPNPNDATKIMNNMSPESLSQMMRTQRDMLKANPAMFEQVVAQNPMMRGMSKEQVLKQLDVLAEMDPQRLATMMNAAQRVSSVTEPARKTYARLDRVTGGKAKLIVIFVVGLLICWFVERYFLS